MYKELKHEKILQTEDMTFKLSTKENISYNSFPLVDP